MVNKKHDNKDDHNNGGGDEDDNDRNDDHGEDLSHPKVGGVVPSYTHSQLNTVSYQFQNTLNTFGSQELTMSRDVQVH